MNIPGINEWFQFLKWGAFTICRKEWDCLYKRLYPNVFVAISGPEPKPEFKGESRTFRLWLDTNQYQQDMAATVQGNEV